MLRIGLSSRELAPLKGWGAGTYAALQALALSRAGHEVHLFSDAPGFAARGEQLFPGIKIHEIDVTQGDAALPGYDNEHFRYSLAAMRAIRDVHAKSPLDIIEFPDVGAEGYFTLRARQCGEFTGVRFGLRLHLCDHQIRALNGWPWEDRWLASLRAMERFCIEQSDVLLAPSNFVAVEAIRSVPQAGDRVKLLRYPFSSDFLNSEFDAPTQSRPRVLYTGRLEARKGVADFVSAAVALLEDGADAVFTLIGGDTPTAPGARSMKEHLVRSIPSRYRSSFEFITEQRSRAEVSSYLRSATVCCFPARADNFPFAALEAMDAARAIVTTDACGVSEILRSEHDAIIVRPKAAYVSTAIKRLMTDAALRTRIGAAARETLRRECEPSNIVKHYINQMCGAPTRVSVTSPDNSVDVIIPVFNSHRYLDQTLRSIREQRTPPTRIIVVDDGSTDPQTRGFLDALKGVQVVRQENRGLSEARNAGVRQAAKSRWVLMLDSDDLLEPMFITKALEAANHNPGATMITAPMMCFRDEEPARRSVYVPIGFDRLSLVAWNCAGPSIALIDRRRLIDLGGYDPAFEAFEDWELWCRFARAGEQAVVLSDFLILNRIREDSMLRSLSRDRADMLRVMMMNKHPDLSPEPALSARILHGEIITSARRGEYGDVDGVARDIVRSNLRYRIADRVNLAVKKLGVHESLKRMLSD